MRLEFLEAMPFKAYQGDPTDPVGAPNVSKQSIDVLEQFKKKKYHVSTTKVNDWLHHIRRRAAHLHPILHALTENMAGGRVNVSPEMFEHGSRTKLSDRSQELIARQIAEGIHPQSITLVPRNDYDLVLDAYTVTLSLEDVAQIISIVGKEPKDIKKYPGQWVELPTDKKIPIDEPLLVAYNDRESQAWIQATYDGNRFHDLFDGEVIDVPDMFMLVPKIPTKQ